MRAVLIGAVSAWSAGCFSPQFDQCAVACGAGDACPPGTVCREDGMCHASMAEPLCTTGGGDGGPDAREDGGVPDAPLGDAGPPVTPTMAGQLVISEVMINPLASSEEPREWFEIHNPSATTSYDLFGILVRGQRQGDEVTFSIDTSLVIGPGEQLLFGRSGDTAANGGLDHDFVYGDQIELGNTSGEVALVYPLGEVLIDEVAYGSSIAGWPREEGQTISLDPDLLDAAANDNPDSWCLGTGPYTAEPPHEQGTPGALNPACP